jgi:glycosyltransferase involved in cell wall biosynthesis
MTTWQKELEKTKLSIIVPVFNEARSLHQNLDLLIDEVEGYFPQFEVIVVSDGSTDETNLKLASFRHKDVKPLIIQRNEGKGAAVRSGFKEATGQYILFIDGGMEIHPREIRVFAGLMSLYGADIVMGSKRHPQSKIEYPLLRRFLSWCFQRMVRAFFKVDVTDTQVGIKLFRREVIEAILPYLEVDRYGFDLEILSLARAFGFSNMLEAPIRMDYFMKNDRGSGRELFHVWKIGFSLLRDTFRLYRRIQKLRRTGVLSGLIPRKDDIGAA